MTGGRYLPASDAGARGVLALQAQKLTGFLPEPPEGWTREIEDSAGGGIRLEIHRY